MSKIDVGLAAKRQWLSACAQQKEAWAQFKAERYEGPAMADAAVTAASAHKIAGELRRHHDRWFWLADLHGTVTPSEFVKASSVALLV